MRLRTDSALMKAVHGCAYYGRLEYLEYLERVSWGCCGALLAKAPGDEILMTPRCLSVPDASQSFTSRASRESLLCSGPYMATMSCHVSHVARCSLKMSQISREATHSYAKQSVFGLDQAALYAAPCLVWRNLIQCPFLETFGNIF